jgi:DNA recombination protein RmuC
MDALIAAAIVAAAVIIVIGLFFFRSPGGGASNEKVAALQGELQAFMQSVSGQFAGLSQTITAQVTGLSTSVNTTLGTNSEQLFKQMREQFGASQQLVTNVRDAVKEQLTEVATRVGQTQEATSKVFAIADQISDLKRVLTSQKQRGSLGEAALSLILQNILAPTDYELQYRFQNGEAVDAAIKAPEGIIPVDAKFPLENYQRIIDEPDPEQRAVYEAAFKTDLKNRIDETAKYIRPNEGTMDFAFMFIPAEAIYYDLLVNEVGAVRVNTRSLIDYAFNVKKVIIVSPTTFAAYLQTVLQAFRAFRIEREAQAIAKNVENLGRHLKAYEDFFVRLGSSLSTTVNHYNAAGKELGKIDKDVLRITGEKAGLDIAQVDRPQLTAE